MNSNKEKLTDLGLSITEYSEPNTRHFAETSRIVVYIDKDYSHLSVYFKRLNNSKSIYSADIYINLNTDFEDVEYFVNLK